MLAAQLKKREKENKEVANKNRAKLKQELQKNKASAKSQENVNKIKENIKKHEILKYEEPFLNFISHKNRSTKKRK